ncbi:N-acetylglutaminylglutamine synthetase [bacterium]|nr:N-acetylglutaminylglutamine synthetase [bacterium]
MKTNRTAIQTIEEESPTLSNWNTASTNRFKQMKNDISLDIGWGKLVFAHTYNDQKKIAKVLLDERADERNIAFYVPDPHVILSQAPQDVFLDPSHTFRIWLEDYKSLLSANSGFIVRRLKHKEDVQAINTILQQLNMVELKEDVVWEQRNSPLLTVLLAEEIESGSIVGSVMGVDHRVAFDDPENGSSLWALAVNSFTPLPGIGEALVRGLIEYFQSCNRAYLDLSVMHDNTPAISLYEKLGFHRIPVFSVKRKNTINEPLYTTTLSETHLNPYAMIIIKEAKKRGIQVEVVDEDFGLFNLSFGGVQISCRESLTDLTSAVVMSTCDNKMLTWRILKNAGLNLPDQQLAGDLKKDKGFLQKHHSIVVKPAQGEQGKGVFVDIRTLEEMEKAIDSARRFCDQVILEEMVTGQDLRIVLINYKIVAAAIRQPPSVVGDGGKTVLELIEKLSKRRQAQTDGESQVPLDDETRRCVTGEGYELEDVLPRDECIRVRKTANLHTGGKLIDVTTNLHPEIEDAAIKAAEVLRIPVVGLDFIVNEPNKNRYSIIEANERPGLANHEPQPTAERFIDLLFPSTASLSSLD